MMNYQPKQTMHYSKGNPSKLPDLEHLDVLDIILGCMIQQQLGLINQMKLVGKRKFVESSWSLKNMSSHQET